MHPGSILNIIRKMTTYKLSIELKMDIEAVKGLLNGDTDVNKTIAKKLAKVTLLTESTWLNMQKEYDRANK